MRRGGVVPPRRFLMNMNMNMNHVCPDCKYLMVPPEEPHVCPSPAYQAAVSDLVSAAAIADEVFDADELERAAWQYQQAAGNTEDGPYKPLT